MEEIREEKKISEKRPHFFRIRLRFVLFWILILGMLSAFIIGQVGVYNDLRGELDRITSLVEAERSEVESLEIQIQFFDNDAYIEELARERLGMVRPNEIVFRVVD